MTTKCKNCNTTCKTNFCGNCGQSQAIDRITLNTILADLQNGLFSFENGALYTIKCLFTRPGYAIKDYLYGKRVIHYRPISFLIVLSALSIALGSLFDFDVVNIKIDIPQEQSTQILYWSNWLKGHFAIAELILLPLFSLITYALFFREGYNFLEHIVINSFLGCQRLLVRPVLLLIVQILESLSFLIDYFLVVEIILVFWSFNQLYNTRKWYVVFLKTVLSFLILIIVLGTLVFGLLRNYFNFPTILPIPIPI